MTLVATPPRDEETLRASFEAFNRISRDLEHAYDRLREQAGRVDIALADSNRRLSEKVQELDRLSGHLRAVLGSLREAVVVTGVDGRITLVNRALEELTGRPAAELEGTPRAGLRDLHGRPVCTGSSNSQSAGPRPLEFADGSQRMVRSSSSPVLDSRGELLGEVETLVDETETQRLLAELRRSETLAALGEMAAGIAHELRNPLGAVEGFAHLLLRSLAERPEACPAHAERVIRGVRKADAIISNLLCFAHPERFRPHRIRVAALLEGLRSSAAAPQLEIAPVDAELEVEGNAALLERVLINLLDNAREATGESGRIRVSAARRHGGVVLQVEDDGPGIPPELAGRLFLPFVTGRADGTGLGLAIVHRIVDLHRGRIEARPRTGGGTVFHVELPSTSHPQKAAGEATA